MRGIDIYYIAVLFEMSHGLSVEWVGSCQRDDMISLGDLLGCMSLGLKESVVT